MSTRCMPGEGLAGWEGAPLGRWRAHARREKEGAMVETAGEASTLPASVAVPGAGEAAAAVHEADETAGVVQL